MNYKYPFLIEKLNSYKKIKCVASNLSSLYGFDKNNKSIDDLNAFINDGSNPDYRNLFSKTNDDKFSSETTTHAEGKINKKLTLLVGSLRLNSDEENISKDELSVIEKISNHASSNSLSNLWNSVEELSYSSSSSKKQKFKDSYNFIEGTVDDSLSTTTYINELRNKLNIPFTALLNMSNIALNILINKIKDKASKTNDDCDGDTTPTPTFVSCCANFTETSEFIEGTLVDKNSVSE